MGLKAYGVHIAYTFAYSCSVPTHARCLHTQTPTHSHTKAFSHVACKLQAECHAIVHAMSAWNRLACLVA
jgi:hypothetical protein